MTAGTVVTGGTEAETTGDTTGDGTTTTTGGSLCGRFDCPGGNPCQAIECGEPPIFHDQVVGGMFGFYEENCSLGGCHDSVTKTGGLSLAAEDDPWCDIVDRPSKSSSPLNLVEMGEPLQSYMWHKLNGSHACPGVDGEGDVMPPFPTCGLSDPELAFVTEWICCGAPKRAEDPNGDECFVTGTGGSTGTGGG